MRFSLFIGLFILTFFLSAQERCGTKIPETTLFENWLQQKIQSKASQGRAFKTHATVYEIPVVVHIIEPPNGSLNISDARVLRQIEILNEDFRRTNADAINTPTVFLPVASDTEIQFTLAKQDPEGNPTNGIVRVQGSKNQYRPALDQDLIRSESYWPPANYLNIFVLDLQSFLGYASFPISDLPGVDNTSDDSIWDGVQVDYNYFGENPSASAFPSVGRTATHEIGHYLGLRHIWGDGGCGVDDFVTDTPIADDDNGGLSSPCTFPSDDNTVCSTDEMFQNYMDYTDDGCMNLFTTGQRDRMRTILENSPRRTSLLSSPALVEPARFSNDLAIQRVLSPNYAECDNLITPSLEVSNHGSNPITSYDLALSIGGSQVQSVNQITSLNIDETEVVAFSSEVIAETPTTVEFSISNVNGMADGNSLNDTRNIPLSQATAASLPFSEDFESDLNILGNNGANEPWEVATAPREVVTNKALKFKSFQSNTAFGEDTWIKTPIFDLSGINSAKLSFSYAYASTSATFWDGLAVKVSTDCGASFSDDFLFNSYGPNLATAASTDDTYIPQNTTEWRDTVFIITPSAFSDIVQFAFVGQNGGGNNIYIDNISIIQANLNARDISVLEVESPVLTCRNTTSVDFRVRNVGFEKITSFTYEYSSGGTTVTETASGLSLNSGVFQTVAIDVDLSDGDNDLSLTVTDVNGASDDDLSNNSTNFSVEKTLTTDSYPLLVDFETSNDWKVFSESSQKWTKTFVSDSWALYVDAFHPAEIGTQSWFISPSLDIGTLDSAGLAFKVSYAERTGFSDRLQVLMSVNCGESHPFEIFNASSDSLAITQSNSAWSPKSTSDWKEFKLDLKSSIVWNDEIRLAFVFTNGSGNNIFLDDIQVGIKPISVTENSFNIFPNPAISNFNVAFSLAERDDVVVQLMDISGKIIYTRRYKNVLDQVYDFSTVAEEGFYFVKITGKQINKIERLYIRR
ncbi:MAG: choice-of-anchor J domain-containing protein [Cyclobacteriaceae bacterium]